jgi:catechol-2,3-dioxygenase
VWTLESSSGRRERGYGMECPHRGVLVKRSTAIGASEMLISKVELPVSDAVEAARFYGDFLGLPTRWSGGVVEVEVGLWPYYCHCGTATRREVAALTGNCHVKAS